jgi:hypothetical protein
VRSSFLHAVFVSAARKFFIRLTLYGKSIQCASVCAGAGLSGTGRREQLSCGLVVFCACYCNVEVGQIMSMIKVEDLIQQFQPTMIFVEHDAAFRDKIATDVIEL